MQGDEHGIQLVTMPQYCAYFSTQKAGGTIKQKGIVPFKSNLILEVLIMNEVVKFLSENPVQYLATIGRDGKAKCRPFMFAGELDGRLWFCTNSQKNVYKELQTNPYTELTVSSPAYAWIRLNGKAVFADSMAAKEMCIANPIVKNQYGEASNPIFEVFYLEDAHAVIADFSGNPPQEYSL